MAEFRSLRADVVIFGGGAAGLWLLDDLHRAGYAVVLLEAGALGQGQTIASQGIIHGGLKYTLSGLFTPAAAVIREMPAIWRARLNSQGNPNLQKTKVRAEYCHLWRTESLSSRLGLIGASVGLQVKPKKIAEEERPAALAYVPGTVSQLDEQVIDPASLINDLASHHHSRIIKIDAAGGLQLIPESDRQTIVLGHGVESLHLNTETIVLTAGNGNGELRAQLGLESGMMQLRPLHMVMVRGEHLAELNGHCVDGKKTRVTITTDRDSAGRIVWQVGGQLAEDGVDMDERALIAHARNEVAESLGGFDLGKHEWATYRVDRAEAATSASGRPDDSAAIREGSVITAWPTKLALVPRLSKIIREQLPEPLGLDAQELEGPLAACPRPEIAKPPWEMERTWFAGD